MTAINTTPGAAAPSPVRPESKLRHIVSSANVHAGDSVLDMGTGAGDLLPYLAEATGRFGTLDAIDLSGEMLAQAHRNHSKLPLPVRFMLADVEADPIHTLYDRIVLLDVLPHLNHPLETLVKMFHKNLTGGGTITIAHSVGRDAVNAQHSESGVAARMLPPATEMAARLTDAGLHVDYVEDSADTYIIRLRRH